MNDNLIYQNQLHEDLEEQIIQRCPYLNISDFERRILKFDYTISSWEIEEEGTIALPTYHPAINPRLNHLHGGILILQVSKNLGLNVYAQNKSVLRLPQPKTLRTPLLRIINNEQLQMPALYSSLAFQTPQNTAQTRPKTITSYNTLIKHLENSF